MKDLLKDKYQRILLAMFIPVLLLAGFVGYVYADMYKKVTVPDFVGKDQKQVYDWCATLDPRYACEISFSMSKDMTEGKVISQSVKKDEVLKDKITFKISEGLIAEIVLPDYSNMKKGDMEAWAKVNGIGSISFVEEESDRPAGTILRVEPSSAIFKDTPLTVIIAKGNGEEGKEGDIEVKAGDFYNLSVERFEQQVKNLGLVPNHLEDYDAYSDSIPKGNVVWHGSGTYVKDEKISYGVSKGINENAIDIKEDVYLDMTEDNFTAKAKELKLSPNHNTDRDAYSSDIEKGRIVWHGSGSYEEGETINYGLSLGKKDSTETDDLNVSENEYAGLSEADFIAKAKALGLKPNHDSGRDAASDKIAKGNVVTHGYGQYEEGETFNYGLSLGKSGESGSDDLYVTEGKYVGLSAEDFEAKAKALKLVPYHDSSVDEYSDTVEKGKVVWHGYGQYEENERFRYGLSLGQNGESVTVEDYSGKSESDFLSYIKGLGLKAGARDTEYSDSIPEGYLISNSTGKKSAGSSIAYTVSAGKKQADKAVLNSFTDLQSLIFTEPSYDKSKENATSYLNNAGFDNYEFVSAKSKDDGAGVLLKVTVDGNEHTSRSEYSRDAKIIFTICSGYE